MHLFDPSRRRERPLARCPGSQHGQLLALKPAKTRKPWNLRPPGAVSKKSQPPGESASNGLAIQRKPFSIPCHHLLRERPPFNGDTLGKGNHIQFRASYRDGRPVEQI